MIAAPVSCQQHFLGPDDATFGYERYVDVLVSGGDWYAGTMTYPGIVEVENEINEFKGTVSDLLKLQARWKIAIFYENPDLERREDEIRAVFANFEGSGFREADQTEYLLILGPPEVTPDSGIGTWRAIRFGAGVQQFRALN